MTKENIKNTLLEELKVSIRNEKLCRIVAINEICHHYSILADDQEFKKNVSKILKDNDYNIKSDITTNAALTYFNGKDIDDKKLFIYSMESLLDFILSSDLKNKDKYPEYKYILKIVNQMKEIFDIPYDINKSYNKAIFKFKSGNILSSIASLMIVIYIILTPFLLLFHKDSGLLYLCVNSYIWSVFLIIIIQIMYKKSTKYEKYTFRLYKLIFLFEIIFPIFSLINSFHTNTAIVKFDSISTTKQIFKTGESEENGIQYIWHNDKKLNTKQEYEIQYRDYWTMKYIISYTEK